MTAPEERQKDVRQTIDSRPLFNSSDGNGKLQRRSTFHNPFLQNVQTKPGCSALTRSDLGVSLKSKEPRESTGDELPSTSLSSAGSSKMLSLCDYTSTSSSEDSQ